MSSKEISVLKHAAENNFNVLLVGAHGVGKTAMVKEVFDNLGWNWKYFSASTIDPWVDLSGIPKEKNGVLEFILPADLDHDNVEAIFLDEYNRSPKQVRNAVMELIQFKSINGKAFPNLKVVWAAINPSDDEEANYDVEKLDPAQEDRFEVHLTVPNNPCPFFFSNNYGNTGTLAVKWWKDQTDEIKTLISPRRLEMGVKMFLAKGDPQYVFDPTKVNIGEFCEFLDKPDPIELLNGMIGKPEEEARAFFRDQNKLKHVQRDLLGKERYLKEFAHLLPEAILMTELRDTRGNRLIGHVVANVERFEPLIPVVLNNASKYSARVVSAFKEYRANNMGQVAPNTNRQVTINGKQHEMSALCFCFSGKLAGYTREEVQDLVQSYGSSVTKDITFQTTHLVTGNKTGSKIQRAKRQNVEVVSQDDFYKIIQQLEGVTLK